MAKDDSTLLYVAAGVAAFLYWRHTQAATSDNETASGGGGGSSSSIAPVAAAPPPAAAPSGLDTTTVTGRPLTAAIGPDGQLYADPASVSNALPIVAQPIGFRLPPPGVKGVRGVERAETYAPPVIDYYTPQPQNAYYQYRRAPTLYGAPVTATKVTET